MKQEKWIEQLRDKLADYKVEAPEGLWEDIEAALPEHSEKHRPASMIPLRRWAIAASLAIILATGGYWWFGNRHNSLQSNLSQEPQLSQSLVETTPDETLEAQLTPGPSIKIPQQSQDFWSHESVRQNQDSDPTALTKKVHVSEETEYPQKSPNEENIVVPDEAPQHDSFPRDEESVVRQLDQQIAQLHTSSSKIPTISLYAMNGFGHQSNSNGVIMSSNLTQNFVNPSDYQGQMARRRETIYLAGYEERQKHNQPISFGLTVSYPLCRQLSLSTGIVFTHLQSNFVKVMRSQQISQKQKLDYIGIPVMIDFKVWSYKGLKTYISMGLQTDWNIHTSLQAEGVDQQLDKDRMQWSVVGALGAQYDIIPQIGIYAEPGIRHYFDNGSNISNYFKDKPTCFSLQLGLRLSLMK